MLRALLPVAFLAFLPLAAAGPGLEPGEPPCDGQPLVPGVEPENQLRFQGIACQYGPQLTSAVCDPVSASLAALYLAVKSLDPGQEPPQSC